MAKRGLAIVERNTRLQAQLIGDLLDMSRAISGKLRLEVRDVDLTAVIEDAIQTVQPAADAKRIAIDRAFDRSMGSFAGDPARLQQCVWNLLSNAVKFTPDGGRVQIELRRLGSQAEIAVSDDGIGIRKELLPSIFDRFHQGDAGTTRRYGGLGLGLAIVKELAELHGGSVRAESNGEGKGATFTLSIPIRRLQPESAPAAAASEEEISLENVRVLLVEDDADTRELVQRILEGHHAAVRSVGSAREALRVLGEERLDVLVCDIGLPEVDGYELIEQVRDRGAEAGGAVPALALTAYARVEDRTTALRAGFQAHIAKPVEPAELIVTVARLAATQRV
jgi:CheY-like chemotaxis protein/two-component sensor histidine kinase